ncbi:tuliposide A-converting enzyme 1, chloroplastic isoform X2 [Brachypodium distachyon]|uniref:tuliposide A-converting enzyme 1, chloroplastic isoform X2 n=1 Tax=Brachypodium distachyon TaxID=15368 RepID=UPI00071D7438|nr:tuliposide A-converting enzyme 1, chloroplastic isoform X2 [Brachypodium distachyon]|eukprot:XP_014756378.1 tuliposide A-converting enzyme 1, chloroplastic isoform X2 [Brachypodium distachyon]
MDPDTDVDFDFSPFLVRYKSGRVHRLMGAPRFNAGTDAATGVTCKDIVMDAADAACGIAARLYLPKDVPRSAKVPILVYFHGGAFAVHSAFSAAPHHRFLNSLVAAAGVVAVSVDYRLAPEHPLPAAYDDAWAALAWTLTSGLRKEPWLAEHGDKDPLPSESRNNPGFLQRAERSWGFVCSWRYGIDHPFINPLAMPAEEWAALGCRRALVTAAGLDTMRDRARRYVETLRGSGEWAGEEAALYETDGEGHVYFLENSGPGADKAQKELDAVVLFIKRS